MNTQTEKQTPGIAIASLVCGILGLAACLGPLAGIPAIIMGHMAYSRIRLKQFPLCPASETSVQSAEQAAADYNINPMGVSAECAIRGNDPKDPHALAQ